MCKYVSCQFIYSALRLKQHWPHLVTIDSSCQPQKTPAWPSTRSVCCTPVNRVLHEKFGGHGAFLSNLTCDWFCSFNIEYVCIKCTGMYGHTLNISCLIMWFFFIATWASARYCNKLQCWIYQLQAWWLADTSDALPPDKWRHLDLPKVSFKGLDCYSFPDACRQVIPLSSGSWNNAKKKKCLVVLQWSKNDRVGRSDFFFFSKFLYCLVESKRQSKLKYNL